MKTRMKISAPSLQFYQDQWVAWRWSQSGHLAQGSFRMQNPYFQKKFDMIKFILNSETKESLPQTQIILSPYIFNFEIF